jgi:hypothetical protein
MKMAARRIVTKSAEDLAKAVAHRLIRYGGAVALFLLPDGSARIVPDEGGNADRYRRRYTNAEVGRYDCGARFERIVADVKASLAK